MPRKKKTPDAVKPTAPPIEYTPGPALTFTKSDPETDAAVGEAAIELAFSDPPAFAELAALPKMSGADLAAVLRQNRREQRLAEKGY